MCNIILEKLESSKINYYSQDKLEKFFNENNIVFNLEYSKVPFAPSFKRVWKRLYDTEKNWLKITDKSKTEEKNLAKRNFMKIIYYNLFLHNFTANTTIFKKTVNEILKNNENNARHYNEWAYKEISKFSDDDKIEDYLSNIQSKIIQDNEKENPKNYFSRFVLDIFKEGFKNYIEKLAGCDFILNPNDNPKNNGIDLKNIIKIKLDIFENLKYHHILFYGLMKLSDANTINSLRNEILKYQQATEEDLSIYYSIIQLASLSNNRILTQINNEIENDKKEELFGKNEIFKNFYNDKEEWNSKLEVFADLSDIKNSNKLSNNERFYFQIDKNRKEVPKIIFNLEYIRKYGTYDILKNINIKKVNSTDIKEYYGESKKIEDLYKEQAELHSQWVNQNWAKDKENKYEKNVKDIAKYSNLVNKIKLNNLSKMQKLLIEFLGKMVGYVSIWERDLIFFLLTLNYFKLLRNENDFLKEDLLNIFKMGNKYKQVISKNNENIHNDIISPLFFKENETEIFECRNAIDHLDFLKRDNKSLLEYLREIRIMLAYDRKLKNSVTKSFIKIAEQHKIKISFDFDYSNSNHIISIKNVESMKNNHLNNKIKDIPSHSDEFIKLVEQLFEYGKNESTSNS